MKKVLSLLLIFVFLQVEAWALSGGPVFGGGQTNFVGTYSGVLVPSSESSNSDNDEEAIDPNNDGDPTTGTIGPDGIDTSAGGSTSSSIGLFSIAQPDVGIATGALVLFIDGAAFNASITGIIDPDTGTLSAVIDGLSTFVVVFFIPTTTVVDGAAVTTFTRTTFPVFATGSLDARVIALGSGSGLGQVNTAFPSRVVGTASIDVFFTISDTGTPVVDRSATFEVDGFKQSDDSTAATAFNFGQNFNNNNNQP